MKGIVVHPQVLKTEQDIQGPLLQEAVHIQGLQHHEAVLTAGLPVVPEAIAITVLQVHRTGAHTADRQAAHAAVTAGPPVVPEAATPDHLAAAHGAVTHGQEAVPQEVVTAVHPALQAAAHLRVAGLLQADAVEDDK